MIDSYLRNLARKFLSEDFYSKVGAIIIRDMPLKDQLIIAHTIKTLQLSPKLRENLTQIFICLFMENPKFDVEKFKEACHWTPTFDD